MRMMSFDFLQSAGVCVQVISWYNFSTDFSSQNMKDLEGNKPKLHVWNHQPAYPQTKNFVATEIKRNLDS